MRRPGGHRGVEWAGPDAASLPEERSRRPFLDVVRRLAGGSSAASGAARAIGIILLASTVFVVVLGSIETAERPVETVRMPSLVRNTPVPPEPEPIPIRRPSANFERWLSPATDFRQIFSETGAGTPEELCRRLSDLGYPRARWSQSKVFRGEWECSSDLDPERGQGRGFLLIRGADETNVGSLMLKLIAEDDAERGDLIGKAAQTVETFSAAAGLALSPEAMPMLTGWQVGQTWTSRGTFRIAAEAGKQTVRIVSMAVVSPLMRPAGDECREPCRTLAGVLAKRGEARRVKTELRAMR